MHLRLNPGPSEPQYSTLIRVTSGKSHNLKGFRGHPATGCCGLVTNAASIKNSPVAIPAHLKSTVLGAWNLTRTLALNNSITEDAQMGNESTSSLEQAERVDHQLVR